MANTDSYMQELCKAKEEVGDILPYFPITKLEDAIKLHTLTVNGTITSDEHLQQRLFKLSRKLINLYYVLL